MSYDRGAYESGDKESYPLDDDLPDWMADHAYEVTVTCSRCEKPVVYTVEPTYPEVTARRDFNVFVFRPHYCEGFVIDNQTENEHRAVQEYLDTFGTP